MLVMTPDLLKEIQELTAALKATFAPPEFIPGCEVTLITDIDQYASNNGWIEAVCGQHNNQRCRWKSGQDVTVGSFVDVIYFADRRIFEVVGIGGGDAIGSAGMTGKVWLIADQVLTTHTTIGAALSAAVDGDTIVVPNGTYTETLTVDKAVTLSGIGPNETIITSSTNDSTTVTVTDAATLMNLKITNTGAGTTSKCVFLNTGASTVFINNSTIEKISGAATNSYAAHIAAGTGHVIENCRIRSTAGTNRYGVLVDSGVATVTISDGRIQGQTADVRVNNASAQITLQWPILVNESYSIGAGDIGGTYLSTAGWPFTMPDTKLTWGNGAVEAPFNMTARAAAPSSPNTEDVYLDGGTNTLTGKPFFKRRTSGAAWEEIGLPPLFKNPYINGAFQIWQRGTTFTSVANGTYTADRHIYSKVGTMVHDISRSTDVPTVSQAGVLVPYSFLVDCTTADASIAASDLCIIRHYIEGYNFADLAQRQFTLSFWVKATKTGIYCVSFSNSGGDRTYAAEYTVDTTDTWELKTITVTASPSAGTWDYTTGIGLTVTWVIDAGSNFHITGGAWQSSGGLSTSNQVNGSDNAANNFRLALIGITPGAVALAPRLPDIGQEFARCQRYAWVTDATSQTMDPFLGSKASTTLVVLWSKMPVIMRAAPSLTHNITGYTAGTPTTTTIGIVDYGNNAFSTITGALTVSLIAANTEMVRLNAAAGTSWTGTAGQVFGMRLGPNVQMVFAPSDYS